MKDFVYWCAITGLLIALLALAKTVSLCIRLGGQGGQYPGAPGGGGAAIGYGARGGQGGTGGSVVIIRGEAK